MLGCQYRQRAARACTACIAAALAHRAYVMVRVRLWAMVPVPFYGPFAGDTQARLHYLWSASYLSLASHLPALCLGVLAHLALSSPAFMAGFARSAVGQPFAECLPIQHAQHAVPQAACYACQSDW